MIEPDMRNAIFQLHEEGMSMREVSRCLHISRNAVRRIVRQQGKLSRKDRSDKIQIEPELLERLYHQCDGWLQRIHERLAEEEGIQVAYSTLTRMLRDLGVSCSRPVRCDRVPSSDGVWRLMASSHGGPLNLGTSRLITINALVDLVSEIAGKKLVKQHNLEGPQGVRGRNSDNTKVYAALGWEPLVTLVEGMATSYYWIENELIKEGRLPAVASH